MLKQSARAQIIYHCSILPRSIPGIVIYILPQGGAMARDIEKYIYL
jgi:hypothetical protein